MSEVTETAVPLEIVQAEARDMDEVRALFRDYADEVGGTLCFQEFAAELAGLPGAYAPPAGRLLVARAGGAPVGCVALRPLRDGWCEMKRLYLRPAFRGDGGGCRLAEAAIAAAREIGYERICLETLPSMAAARALYARLGFRERPADQADGPTGVIRLDRVLP